VLERNACMWQCSDAMDQLCLQGDDFVVSGVNVDSGFGAVLCFLDPLAVVCFKYGSAR